ncbi:MAG: DUF3575 domain-containing protein [Saprospiraceae bacterium]
MKSNYLLLLLLFTLSTSFAQKNVIKGNPIAFAAGIFNAEWEKAINSKSSFSVGAGVAILNDLNGFLLSSSYRFYITNRKKLVPEGLYVGGDGILIVGFEDETNLLIGANVGYQWIWESGFTMDLGIGPHYLISDNYDSGTIPYPTFTIGYNF